MILKSIEMQGFKSFADKIYLDFNSGITAIVGPNGSGKSNISDAIRWVMGEQSIKSLRGSRMEDVIFAGTESRKALGFAEVVLNLDNESGIFNIDFPEIRVSRRLYRSGESEYYINKTLCRLKDVHELFMDTGLGRDGYSIIGQGQIDNILSTKSEDRRHIFEEASGISKYKYRKIEAERKLERTADNITRVEDILGELEERLEPLRRQSEKAKKYLILRDEMKDLEINASVISIDKKREAMKKLGADIEIYEGQMEKMRGEIADNDKKVEALYAAMEKIDADAEKGRESEKALTAEGHEIRGKISLAENEISHSEGTIDRLRNEIGEGDKRAMELDKRIEELRSSLDTLNSQSGALEKSVEEFTEKSRKSGVDVSEESRVIEELRAEIIEKTAAAGSKRSEVSSRQILLDSFVSRAEVIKNELENKSLSLKEMKERLVELDGEIEKSEAYSESLKKETNKSDELYGLKNAEMQKMINDKNRSTIKLGELNSRKKMLEDMERDLEGYSRGVKGVMTAFKSGRLSAGIHGPLSRLIKTDKKYITAIETALGSAAQNIVTDDADDAKRAIKYLKDRRLGRATFLPISDIRARGLDDKKAEKLPGFIGTADSLVEYDEKYTEIVSNILGPVVIVDNIDNAAAMGKKCGYKFRIVTLGGDVVQPGGAMTGGSALKTIGSLSRVSEIAELDGKIKKAEKDIVGQTKSINTLSIETADLLEDIKKNNQRLSECGEELARLSSERLHLSSVIKTSGDDREKMAAELEELNKNIESVKGEIDEAVLSAEKLEAETEELSRAADKREKSYAELSGENEKLSRALLDLTIRRSSVIKDIEQTNELIRSVNNEKAQIISSTAARLDEIRSLEKHIAETEAEIKRLEKSAETNRETLEELSVSLSGMTEKRREAENRVKKQQEAVNDVRDRLIELSNVHAKARSGYENLDAELESVINRLWEEYELTYSDARQGRDLENFDFEAATKRVNTLRRQIRNLGSINVDAIEEYKSVKERADFLTAQVDDLNKSKKELKKIIVEMMSIMKTQFAEQFVKINESFNKVFASLFGGGRAKLTLTDPDNVLESGIEIEAQPPGKKLQSLTLLSGGEKALSAIALLFAILNVRPTPFCILDEVEAALDDVNVYRFAAYLKRYSENTQFIVVTHKRGTMEAANMLYGVTMQEKGVSKLLSLNIDEVSE